uniref:DUF427 domain-containing protein n=1 Tax=Tetradesmus obliquus TaxID=3088 RepID=A0A383VBA0_TETOB|eukprot:jgi/Sobl393_1/18205/SZX62223.1
MLQLLFRTLPPASTTQNPTAAAAAAAGLAVQLPIRLARRKSCRAMAAQKEKVWDYPRPPRLEPTSRHLVVKLGDTVIADTTQAYRVLETSHPPTYYLPPADCREQFFTASSKGQTFCEWKGKASYHDVAACGQEAKARVWSYQNPTQPFAAIKGYYSFYASPFTCEVDSEVVQAQPGDFYGGWVTSDVEGPFKGAPGTMRW